MKNNDPTDPDKAKIDKMYPSLLKVGDPFEMETGLMQGKGFCIKRALTARGGVLFTIQFDDGRIKEWEWFD